jgi:hypothetical protein
LGGDLEAVEDEAGTVDVEFVGREADDDFADGVLQGASVGGCGEVEAAAFGRAVRAFGPAGFLGLRPRL